MALHGPTKCQQAGASTIAIEREDGTVAQVYCRLDGHVPHVGRILQDHYSDPAKLEQLLARGTIYRLGREIGEQHASDYKNDTYCSFYGRDMTGRIRGISMFDNWQDYLENGDKQEYNYVLRCGGLDALNPVWEVAADEWPKGKSGTMLTELEFVPLIDKIVEYAQFVLSHGATNLTNQQEHV